MTRRARLYERCLGLQRNPFPDHAIAAAGRRDEPFYPDLYPGIMTRMSRAFIGAGKPPLPVRYLWSLGEGGDARGYGKTRHLLWFADQINADQGARALQLAECGAGEGRLIAVYAAFNATSGLSLSNLLFDAVGDLLVGRRDVTSGLRSVVYNEGRSAEHFHREARRLAMTGAWSPALLSQLCFAEPERWAHFIDNRQRFSEWHRVRYGMAMFRSAIAFLRALSVSRVLVLVDQIEDFARWTTAPYKLRRDLSRLAALCMNDELTRNHVTFVLTMHPAASRVLSRYWGDSQPGLLASHWKQDHTVKIGAPTPENFVKMVATYLKSARHPTSDDLLHPFTVEALHYVHALSAGRPGQCLAQLHSLIELAVNEEISIVDKQAAMRLLDQSGDSPGDVA